MTSTADIDLPFTLNARALALRTILPAIFKHIKSSEVEIIEETPFIEIIAAITPLKTSPIPPQRRGAPKASINNFSFL